MENPEKYISIEYDKWLNYYKPLEENYNKLERELKEEKENKEIKVYLNTHDRVVGTRNIRFGTIDFSVYNNLDIRFFNREKINDSISSFLSLHFNNSYSRIATKEEINKISREINEKLDSISKIKLENEERINKIPKIIRKIFKIKTNE